MSQLAADDCAARPALEEPPLVIDLDGTLLRSDMLVETFSVLLAGSPAAALGALPSLRAGKAAFKAHVAGAVEVDVAALPWNAAVLDLIAAEQARGRRIYLASAADRRLVEKVAEFLGPFDGIFASDADTNLSGRTKADALCAAFGEGGFDYAGNAAVDLKVWERARHPIVVNAPARLERRVRARWPAAQVLAPREFRPAALLRALRVHQWLKNLLLAVPLLGAHEFAPAQLLHCLIAFFAFSLCASGVYVINDLLDLERDRRHRTKRNRPFAAGTVPVLTGLVMVPLLLLASLALALVVGPGFLGILALYFAATLAYSLVLKRQMMLDVVVLAGLYGVRMLAGAVATGIALSAWLGAFSLFLFTSLALIKRASELADRAAAGLGDPAGRGYRVTDLPIVEALAAASGFTAILVFGLYLHSDAVALLYRSPNRLWLVCVILVYWLGRVLILTHRNEMHEDPVVFAATDRTSQALCRALAGRDPVEPVRRDPAGAARRIPVG
ncbi:MAG: UbiA family prenyltransferase [Dongiaceae bacterium]